MGRFTERIYSGCKHILNINTRVTLSDLKKAGIDIENTQFLISHMSRCANSVQTQVLEVMNVNKEVDMDVTLSGVIHENADLYSKLHVLDDVKETQWEYEETLYRNKVAELQEQLSVYKEILSNLEKR
jgi:hypothetical protein